MRRLQEISGAIERAVDRMRSGSRKLAIARTVIAVAQLTTLLFSQWNSFFIPSGGVGFGPDCTGIAKIGAYCLLWPMGGVGLPSAVMIVGLLVVLSGYFPRYTGMLHAWLTLSFSAAIKLPDGGESVAQIVVLLLAIVLLADPRINHWHREDTRKSVFAPVSWGAWHTIRLQLVWIYLNAAITKTAVPEWQDGSAIYYFTLDPMFGTAGPLGGLFDWLATQPITVLGMTWGAIVIEMSIAILLLGPSKYRSGAFWLSALLHTMFIVMIGLWSFALIMIAAVMIATGPSVRTRQLFPLLIWRKFDSQRSEQSTELELKRVS